MCVEFAKVMAIQQTKKQSDLEKRLQLLRRQLHASGQKSEAAKKEVLETLTYKATTTTTQRSAATLSSSDLSYLRQDLLKITTFSVIAIGIQLFLFFLLKNNILKINLL